MRHSLETRLGAVPSKHLRRRLQYSLQSTKARRGAAARYVLTSLFQKEWSRFRMTRVPTDSGSLEKAARNPDRHHQVRNLGPNA